MNLLRKTTPVALMVGGVAGVFLATLQVADGVFGNPYLLSSAGVLFIYIIRAYLLYTLLIIAIMLLVNLFLCLLFPRRMRAAEYPGLLGYYTGIVAFIVILPVYVWHDNTHIAEILRGKGGFFPKVVFLVEIVGIFALLAYAIAWGIVDFTRKYRGGCSVYYISCALWFMLLYPVFYELVHGFINPESAWVWQIIVMAALVPLLYFPVRLLSRFTVAITALKRQAWIGLGVAVLTGVIVVSAISFLQPVSPQVPASDDDVNIVLITIDALRADHLGCYGYVPPNPRLEGKSVTPNIDRVAQEGLLFENAFSTSSWTLPSVASWITGKWPNEAGVDVSNKKITKTTPTLPEVLRLEGYRCAAFTCNPWLGPETGIGKGFEPYWEYYNDSKASTGLFLDDVWYWVNTKLDILGIRELGRTIVDKQVDTAGDWLDANAKGKFFMWVHLYDPHHPWMPVSPYRQELPEVNGVRRPSNYRTSSSYRKGSEHLGIGMKQQIVNLYDAEVRLSDEAVGRMLDKINSLGLSGRTLVIITADHGEEIFEHNGLEHGHTLYHEVLHVPLIMRLPGEIPSGERIEEAVSLIDMCPTIAGFAGADTAPGHFRGESLGDAIISGEMKYDEYTDNPDNAMPSGRIIYAENLAFFDKDLKVLRVGDWEFIHSRNRFHDPVVWEWSDNGVIDPDDYGQRFTEGDELYNLAEDPFEQTNVIYEYHDIARYLMAGLANIVTDMESEPGTADEWDSEYGYYGSGLRDLTRGYGYW